MILLMLFSINWSFSEWSPFFGEVCCAQLRTMLQYYEDLVHLLLSIIWHKVSTLFWTSFQ